MPALTQTLALRATLAYPDPATGSSPAKWARQPSGRWVSRVSRISSRLDFDHREIELLNRQAPGTTAMPRPCNDISKRQQYFYVLEKVIV